MQADKIDGVLENLEESDRDVNTQSVIVRSSTDLRLNDFEQGFLSLLGQHGLPTDGIFVSVDERKRVFLNLEDVLARLAPEQRARAPYISRFLAAVASGLADAALNYLWNETIVELRRRVVQYDLSYFYDNAVRNPDKRKGLSTEDDLVKIDDFDLLCGAREIGLLSETGYRHLDYIRFNRNWASAAHPNQNELTGLQLISWLETCIREVMLLPLSSAAVQIKKLLSNIKSTTLTSTDARSIGAFFLELTQDQANTLASGFFGLYTHPDTTVQTRDNIRLLWPHLWPQVDELTRKGFGTKYGRFVANNDSQADRLAREFLETVSALSYMPDNLRAAAIETAMDNLLDAHHGWNNFHTEAAFAHVLDNLISDNTNSIPPQVRPSYVSGLVTVFLTNGSGTAWYAEPIYSRLLSHFDSDLARLAILSFTHTDIASKLQAPLCEKQFRILITLMQEKVTAPILKELSEAILQFSGPLNRLKDDVTIKRRVDAVRTILGG